MVEYNSTNSALELGDDDSLKVGDYELQYNSTDDEWQAEYGPTGDTKSIPRATSGSLVPRGLAESVSEGKALADDGEQYDTVQAAVDAAQGWVFVGPGQFDETVDIDTEGVTLGGCGRDTIIDGEGASSASVRVRSNNVTVRNLSVQTTTTGSNPCISTDFGADSCTFDSITVIESNDDGIYLTIGSDHIIKNCTFESTSGASIESKTPRCLIVSNIIQSSGQQNIQSEGDDSIIANNNGDSASNAGVGIVGNDTIFVGNRISNSADRGVVISSSCTDAIVANNRISDSTDEDINDQGTGTVLDDNLTGPSN